MFLNKKKIIIACLLIIAFFGCKKKTSNDYSVEQTNYPTSDFLSNCQSRNDNLSMITDSLNGYKIGFPTGWDVDLSQEEDINGLYSMDTLTFLKKEFVHTFIVHNIDPGQKVSLATYFRSEINGLKDNQVPILEVGSFLIDNQEALWVLNSGQNSEGRSKELLIYTKHPYKNRVVIIHLSVSDTDRYKEHLCSMSDILASLRFLLPTVSASLS